MNRLMTNPQRGVFAPPGELPVPGKAHRHLC